MLRHCINWSIDQILIRGDRKGGEAGCTNMAAARLALQPEASYPAGQWPQSAHRQDIAQEGDWPVAPCGRATHATLERAQTVTESQTRDLKPDYNNEI